MAAAIPIVSSIVVGFLVSKAIQAIGPKLGLSESMTGIAATVGGIYAGGMTYNAATGAAASGTAAGAGDANQIGMDLSMPTQGGDLSLAGSDVAPSGPGIGSEGFSLGGGNAPVPTSAPNALSAGPGQMTPETPSALSISSAPQSGGMLPPTTPTPPPVSSTASSVVSAGTTGTKTMSADPTWYEKLFSSEKTMDLLMAGGQGYGEATMAKEDREYPEQVRREDAKDWKASDPGGGGYLPMNYQYPSSQ